MTPNLRQESWPRQERLGKGRRTPLLLTWLTLVALACSATPQVKIAPTPSKVPVADSLFVTTSPTQSPPPLPTATQNPTLATKAVPDVTPSPTLPPAPTPSETARSTPSVTATLPSVRPAAKPTGTSAEPGCLRPPDAYDHVEVNGETLNARTLWMLQQAAELYAGPGDLLRVTQGSYASAEATSFGTHDGGGAVDISIRDPLNPSQVLWDETDAMVLALRRAGFAAWYRAPGALGTGSPAHIHAIAIGDRELAPAALEQLSGLSGYLRGLDGLPPEYGGPHPDPHGGPVICPWMMSMGYLDLRK